MVEINEDHQMRTNRGYLFRARYYKGVGHHHFGLAETQRQFYSLKRERADFPGGPVAETELPMQVDWV